MTTVADLSAAQQAALYAQVGAAMNAPGFNYDAHIAGNTVNGVFVAPTNTPAAAAPVTPATPSATPVTPATAATTGTSSIAGLTPAQLNDLYSQVGDAMYAPGFSYSAHIVGNTVNGVFVAPVFIPVNTSSLLPMPEAGSAAYQALLTATGGAAANPGFNYAAHVAATVSQSRLDLSYDDVIRIIKETGRSDITDIDLTAYRLSTGSKVGLGNEYVNPTAAKVATTQIEKSDVLKLPAADSAEYKALSLATGGASELPSFNYAAHVAAITSQKVLTALSYSEVMTLIAETGKSDFTNFDLASYQKEKVTADALIDRFVADPTKTKVAAPTVGSAQYNQILQETGLKDLASFDYTAYLSAKRDAELAVSTMHGSASDDVIVAAPNDKKNIFVLDQGNDSVTATDSADILIGGAGNDTLNGGAGIDKSVYSGSSKDYKVTLSSNGQIGIADTSANRDGTDVLKGVERISFADTSLAFDISGNAGASYRLYKAAFDRQPDSAGVGYWMHTLDQGANLANDVANGFLNSQEFQDLYGANTSTNTFITNLYKNVLHRTPDASGAAYWESTINAGVSRASILTNFSESGENIDQVATLVGNGISYTEYVA